MEIFNSLNNLNKDLSLALGFFDGVHLAHKAVIKNAVDFAKKNGKKSAVIFFINHPCCYLWQDVIPQYIISRQQKEIMIADLGIDYLYYLDFKSIFNLSPEKYLSEILFQNFAPCAI